MDVDHFLHHPVSIEETRVYRVLLEHPGWRTHELARNLGLEPDVVRRTLDGLRSAGLASPLIPADGNMEFADDQADLNWAARQPRDTTDAVLGDLSQTIAELRASYRAMRSLTENYWRHREVVHYDGLEVIHDPGVVIDLLTHLQDQAAVQVRAFMRPPYLALADPAQILADDQRQARRMAAGVRYRAVWESTAWENPTVASSLLDGIHAGEQARQFPILPMKLYLIDDQRAVMPLDPASHSDGATLVVHPSGLLKALGSVFEHYWDLAVPITERAAVGPTERLTRREHDVLVLLASGARDDVIARRLALSRSTVARTVTDLEGRFRVTSRFQLGAEAARRGYI